MKNSRSKINSQFFCSRKSISFFAFLFGFKKILELESVVKCTGSISHGMGTLHVHQVEVVRLFCVVTFRTREEETALLHIETAK